jgi:cell division transport system ATP-binding protein
MAWVRQKCCASGQGQRVIELEDVECGYGGRPLLSGVTVTLQPGSFHFLTGPSGAGKTSFLRLCYLALRPTSGRLEIFGQDVRRIDRNGVAAVRQRIGVVHQDCQFLDHLPLAENVALPLAVSGQDDPARRQDVADLLSWTGLTARADAFPPELSGGERQRAALARAVVGSPDIILADEPTGNIDWEMSLKLLQLLVELNRLGKAVVIATHDMNLIRQAKTQVQARVLRIRGGRVEAGGADL